jgi:protein-tyrosine phosphatase
MRSFFCLAALLGLVSNSIVEAEVAPPQPPAASKHQRELPLEGGQNFRELGGYRTLDGRSVRWRLLYRSGSMHFLTAADYAYLEKLGIHTVCDFRDDHERSVEPSQWPAGAAPDILTDAYHMDLAGIGLNKPDHRPTAQEA